MYSKYSWNVNISVETDPEPKFVELRFYVITTEPITYLKLWFQIYSLFDQAVKISFNSCL